MVARWGGATHHPHAGNNQPAPPRCYVALAAQPTLFRMYLPQQKSETASKSSSAAASGGGVKTGDRCVLLPYVHTYYYSPLINNQTDLAT